MESFLQTLREAGCVERAVWDKAYHKSSREHWGVPTPACTQLVRALPKTLSEAELLSFAKQLWETDLFDPMICALKILSLPKMRPSPLLWETILFFLIKVDGWALEDTLAHVAWKCILEKESLLDQVECWTQHPNFWMRRAALVYTLPFAKVGRNPERMLKWAGSYAEDSEWFIQKAIGWWLRVLGAHNPERVIVFLRAHFHKLKRVARHEATRKLPKEQVDRIWNEDR